ncbi:hypothetical protein ACRAWF_46060 [Streptomyces sp. L7]
MELPHQHGDLLHPGGPAPVEPRPEPGGPLPAATAARSDVRR